MKCSLGISYFLFRITSKQFFKKLEGEVKWALESITVNKASGGDGIPADLFKILKDNVVKVLYSICQ